MGQVSVGRSDVREGDPAPNTWAPWALEVGSGASGPVRSSISRHREGFSKDNAAASASAREYVA